MAIHIKPETPGVVVACVFATLCALAISKHAGDPNIVLEALLYWLIFIISAGTLIDQRHIISPLHLLQVCLIPAIWLIVVWIAIPVFTCIWFGTLDTPAARALAVKLAIILPFIFLFSIVGLAGGVLARNFVIESAERLFRTSDYSAKVLQHVERAFKIIAGIVAVLAPVFT